MTAKKLAPGTTWVNRWTVKSKTDPLKKYTVGQKANGEWGCSCPRWIFNREKPRPDCKHIIGIKERETTVMDVLPIAFQEYARGINLEVEPTKRSAKGGGAIPVFLQQTFREITLED
jgi:hypothetical protein